MTPDPREHSNAELEQALRNPRGRRFLAPTSGTGGNGHGYVSTPRRELPAVADEPEVLERIAAGVTLRDEPESIGPAVVSYVEVAHKVDSLRRAAEIEDMRERRRALSLEHRMEDAARRAKRQHVDVSGDLHIVAKMAERARRAGNREPVAAIRRMEAVEALLDGVVDAERGLEQVA